VGRGLSLGAGVGNSVGTTVSFKDGDIVGTVLTLGAGVGEIVGNVSFVGADVGELLGAGDSVEMLGDNVGVGVSWPMLNGDN